MKSWFRWSMRFVSLRGKALVRSVRMAGFLGRRVVLLRPTAVLGREARGVAADKTCVLFSSAESRGPR